MKLASVHLEISFPSPVPATRPVDELRSSRSGFARAPREHREKSAGETVGIAYKHPQSGQSRRCSAGTRREIWMSRISKLALDIQISPLWL